VIAVERDGAPLPALAEIAAAFPGRLEIVEADALGVDWPALVGACPAKIVANLPYNIATPLLLGWLTAEPWPPWYRSLTLMFQSEVAERIAAGPAARFTAGSRSLPRPGRAPGRCSTSTGAPSRLRPR
jgi:16S rRNA (adenine1518-N6/adenine1519-N6)-dimethyltransferase